MPSPAVARSRKPSRDLALIWLGSGGLPHSTLSASHPSGSASWPVLCPHQYSRWSSWTMIERLSGKADSPTVGWAVPTIILGKWWALPTLRGPELVPKPGVIGDFSPITTRPVAQNPAAFPVARGPTAHQPDAPTRADLLRRRSRDVTRAGASGRCVRSPRFQLSPSLPRFPQLPQPRLSSWFLKIARLPPLLNRSSSLAIPLDFRNKWFAAGSGAVLVHLVERAAMSKRRKNRVRSHHHTPRPG